VGIRVMIATDGTDESVEAAQRALDYIPVDAEVYLVSIIEGKYDPALDAGGFAGPLMDEDEAEERFQEAKEEGREAIERTERMLGARSVVERIVPSSASVPDAIASVAREDDVDLIVVGSTQTGWFERHLLGGTDERLLRKAPCPVLVMTGDD